MQMDELISVIVPVYKVEQLLERCVMSILNQTYYNLEVILVDDGSPDRCPQICDELSKQDDRIIVIHQSNKGLSGARNSGLEIATGKYIGFVDSDDFIHPQMYEILCNCLVKTDAMLAICNYEAISDYGRKVNCFDPKQLEYKIYDCEELICKMYIPAYYYIVVAWNKLYCRELFDEFRYLEGKIHEDEFAIHRLLGNSYRTVVVPLPLYYYYHRTDSIMGKGFHLKTLDKLEAYEDRISFLEDHLMVYAEITTFLQYFNELIRMFFLLKRDYPNHTDQLQNLKLKILQNSEKLKWKEMAKYRSCIYHFKRRYAKFIMCKLYFRNL